MHKKSSEKVAEEFAKLGLMSGSLYHDRVPATEQITD